MVFRCLFSDLPNSDHKDTNYFPMISIKTEKVIIASLVDVVLFGFLCENAYFCHKMKKDMATQEQIEALKIDENVFELAEDTELEYLVHFAAPFTGGDRCLVPKGTAFAPHSPMRGDALYMHLADEDNEELFAKMEAQVKINYENLFTRL